MDLIDRKIALEILKELHGEQVVSKYFTHEQCERTRNGILMAYNEIHSMPTVDAVEVVRCRDCLWANTNLFAKELGIVYCNNYGKRKKQDDFCSEGERRGD